LQQDFGWLNDVVRAKKPKRLPVVFTPDEAMAVIEQLQGVRWLMALQLYGGGLRLMECLRLRVKDLDFERLQVTVRKGKGDKDRITLLPEATVAPLQQHLVYVKTEHERALQEGYGGVELPYALARKYPHADREWGWQYVYPAARPSIDPRSGARRRHHLDPSYLQKAVGAAIRRLEIHKHAGCHTFRPFLRHALAGRSNGYPDSPGTARARGRSHHTNLHPCPQTKWLRGEKPRRSLLVIRTQMSQN
jgi:integrase